MSARKYQVNREDVQDDDVVGKKEMKELALSGVQHYHVESEF